MAILTITVNKVVRLAGLDTSVAADTTDATNVISDMQDGIEAEVATTALADATLTPLLNLGVTEILAGHLLEQRGRVVGASEAVQVGGVLMSSRRVLELAGSLRREGYRRIGPYLRRASARISPDAEPRTTWDRQEDLFGPAEADRVSTAER